MNTPIGHRALRQRLERDLPPVSLFLGPESVGKRTMAEYLALFHGVYTADQLNLTDGTLTRAMVRQIRTFTSTAPFGRRKLLIARLDNASDAAQQSLLKLLEEPPLVLRIILTATSRPLPTIASRAHVSAFGLLSDADLVQVLVRLGMSRNAAERGAAVGFGRVRMALALHGSDGGIGTVRAIAASMAAGDVAQFHLAAQTVTETTRALLMLWTAEAMSGSWRVFAAGDDYGMTKEKLRAVFVSLCAVAMVPARLAIRAALEPLVTA